VLVRKKLKTKMQEEGGGGLKEVVLRNPAGTGEVDDVGFKKAPGCGGSREKRVEETTDIKEEF